MQSQHIFYDLIPVLDKDGKETKTEKQEKEWRHDILCISKNDAEVLKKVCKKAYRYDQKFEIHRLNLRFGWSAIIGLLPV